MEKCVRKIELVKVYYGYGFCYLGFGCYVEVIEY